MKIRSIYKILLFMLLCKVAVASGLEAPKIKTKEYYKKTVILIEWEAVKEAKGYNIYKKADDGNYKHYDITKNTSFLDKEIEANHKYAYFITAYDDKGNESQKSEAMEILTKFTPRETMDIYPQKFKLGEKIVVYFSHKKSKEIKKYRMLMQKKSKDISKYPEKIFIRYGYNNWAEEYFEKGGTEAEMSYDEATGYWKYEMVVPTYVRELDFAFRDELNNWDTNNNKDYKLRAIEGNSGIYFLK